MIVTIVLFIVVLLFIGVLAIDIVPQLLEWTGRIRIGRYQSKSQWGDDVQRIASQWLIRTPKIKVTDNTRLILIDMARGNYTKSAIQHWQEAGLLLGLGDLLRRNQSDAGTRSRIEEYLTKTFTNEGQWKQPPQHVDGAILAYAVMKLEPMIDANCYKPALDSVWELIQTHLGKDGTVAYRTFMPNYRYVDTIGFICPFLIRYGLRYEKPECVELAIRQLQDYEQSGMHSELHIPCHAYRLDNHAPLGLYGWGRGLGWYAIGLIDAWLELPEGHKDKASLQERVLRFAQAAMRFQHKNGGWSWTVTRPETRLDSSTTATLAYYLQQASSIPELEAECKESAERAIRYLMSVTRRNGAVDFSQGDTKDIGVYAMLFTILPFTQGFSLRCISLD